MKLRNGWRLFGNLVQCNTKNPSFDDPEKARKDAHSGGLATKSTTNFASSYSNTDESEQRQLVLIGYMCRCLATMTRDDIRTAYIGSYAQTSQTEITPTVLIGNCRQPDTQS